MTQMSLAGAIVRLLVTLRLSHCNAGAVAKYLVSELAKAPVTPDEYEALLVRLENCLAALHSNSSTSMRARDVSKEVERAIADLLARVRQQNGDSFTRGISQETNRARRRTAKAVESIVKWGGTD